MEVTTVSPSPASPTEGDNLCETDVTNVAIHSVTLLICLCGLAGNGAVLWLLPLNVHIFAILDLAFTDFLFLLFMVPSGLLFLVEDVSCSPIMPLTYVSFLLQLSEVSYFWGLYRLTYSSTGVTIFDLCKVYCCKLPMRLWWVVYSAQYWAFFALFMVIPALRVLCQSHEQDQCWAVFISMYAFILLLFAAPTVISRTVDITKAWCGSQQRQLKLQDIVVFLIVLFTLLFIFCNFLQQLGYIPGSTLIFFLLTSIHSSIKPFVYFLAGRCWSPCSMGSLRVSLQRVFEEEEGQTARRDDANTDTVI